MLSEIREGMLASRVYWKFYFGFFPLVFHLFDVRIVLLEVWFLHHLYSSYSFTVSYCPKIHIWWRYENSNLNFSHWSLRPGILSWVRAEGNWWILFCVWGEDQSESPCPENIYILSSTYNFKFLPLISYYKCGFPSPLQIYLWRGRGWNCTYASFQQIVMCKQVFSLLSFSVYWKLV